MKRKWIPANGMDRAAWLILLVFLALAIGPQAIMLVLEPLFLFWNSMGTLSGGQGAFVGALFSGVAAAAIFNVDLTWRRDLHKQELYKNHLQAMVIYSQFFPKLVEAYSKVIGMVEKNQNTVFLKIMAVVTDWPAVQKEIFMIDVNFDARDTRTMNDACDCLRRFQIRYPNDKYEALTILYHGAQHVKNICDMLMTSDYPPVITQNSDEFKVHYVIHRVTALRQAQT